MRFWKVWPTQGCIIYSRLCFASDKPSYYWGENPQSSEQSIKSMCSYDSKYFELTGKFLAYAVCSNEFLVKITSENHDHATGSILYHNVHVWPKITTPGQLQQLQSSKIMGTIPSLLTHNCFLVVVVTLCLLYNRYHSFHKLQ